jgi:hypothetical protein
VIQREKFPGIYTEALSILDEIPYLEQKIKIQEMQEYTYTFSNGYKLPMITFPDDHMKLLMVTDPRQIMRY